MSRHLRRIERMDSGRKNRVVPENAWPGGLFSPELHANVARFTAALAAVGQGIKRANDIEHAVANEREAIAAWLTSQIAYDVREWESRGHAYTETTASGFAAEPGAIIDAIRNGDHHANTYHEAEEDSA